jgi:UDP-N-acetylmuramate--alanine ligase
MHSPYAHVHLIGLGGIHVSAIAKLLLSLGVALSGSDLEENEQVADLRALGVTVFIGHAAEHVPADAEAIVFSSAAKETNPERLEGARRGLPAFNSHQFLGILGKGMKQIVVTGTHGKSTTTAMMAVMAKEAGMHPTVVVGTRVPQLAAGNLEVGASKWLIIEGDEFDHHFLAYHPTVLVINNIEGDHFDVYPTIEAMLAAYRSLLTQVVDGGWIILNADDKLVQQLLDSEEQTLKDRGVRIKKVGMREGSEITLDSRQNADGLQTIQLHSYAQEKDVRIQLSVPGAMNAMNALMCYAAAEVIGMPLEKAVAGLAGFKGIWRRLEKIGEKDGVTVFSDYGHHPTAVIKTLEAVKEFYPNRRLVLCVQPHHRNRTKHLFTEFVGCFDLADVLIVCEIYDVKGRDQATDEAVSSKDLVQAIQEQDQKRSVKRPVSFTQNPAESLTAVQAILKSGDVLIVMGAGDLYKIAYALV